MARSEGSSIVPPDDRKDLALDTASVLANLVTVLDAKVPGLGSALGALLGGWAAERKRRRVIEVLDNLRWDLGETRAELSDVQRQYLRTDEFEELLEKTLRQAGEEHSDEKRRLYGAFLKGLILSPGQPYDEQLRFLRVLEELQPDHLRVLRAIVQGRDPKSRIYMGGSLSVLQERLPDMPEPRIVDLVDQLNDLRLTNAASLNTLMSNPHNISGAILPFGQRFLAFLGEE
jgi:hypothetical protein